MLMPPAAAEDGESIPPFQSDPPSDGISPPPVDLVLFQKGHRANHFYRPDRSRSKQTGGFGVGLSIARSIVEAHKGSIRAECPEEGVIQFVVVLRE